MWRIPIIAIIVTAALSNFQPSTPVWVYNESHVATPNVAWGTPTRVMLDQAAVPGTEMIYRNGLRLTPGFDFTLSSGLLTFPSGLVAGDRILADYQAQ